MINEIRPMNHLTSLQNLICTIGNLPTSYALSLSYEEQIWWLCDFLEKKVFPAIEENTNITEETQQAFIELQNYVRDYFNNLDVQEEINNKLDEMAESGELKNLIFNVFKSTSQKLYLMACTNKYNNGYNNNFIELYSSKNGKEFNKISYNDICKGVDAPNILYKNDYFYLLVDNTDITNHSFRILRTKNLVDWENFYLKLNNIVYNNRIYGAEFFENPVDNKTYIVYSNQIGEMTDDTSKNYRDFRNYIVEIDLENMILKNQEPLIIDDVNRIDPNISYFDGNYYLFVKKEGTQGELTDGQIAEFVSQDLVNWTLITNSLQPFSNFKYEAPNVCKNNDKYIIYVDNYDYSNGGGIFYSESYDLINWTQAKKIMSMTDIGHPSVICIEDFVASKTLIDYSVVQVNNTKDNLPVFNFNKFYQYKETDNSNLNKYLKLFDFTIFRGYESVNIDFNIFDCANNHYNSKYKLALHKLNDLSTQCDFNEYESLYKEHIPVYLVQLDDFHYSVYLKATINNSKPCMQINSLLSNKYIDLKISDYYNYIDELPQNSLEIISVTNPSFLYKKYIKDLNNIKEPGIYTVNSGNTNVPRASLFGQLIVLDNTEKSWLQQIIISNNKDIYIRYFSNNEWSEWKKFNSIVTGTKTLTTNASGDIDTGIHKSAGLLLNPICLAKQYYLTIFSYNNINYFINVKDKNGNNVANEEITFIYGIIE